MNAHDRDRTLYELPTNVVVAAGAGTGKTHRLTGVYVHLVGGLTELGGVVAPDAIVATTFTREAASEMRTRIEARLRRLAERPLAALVRDDDAATLAWATEIAATCERRRCEPPPTTTWRRALDALPRATISTFHAWAGELVRAHPLEADAPPGFALLEPNESDAIVLEALRATLAAWSMDDARACDDAPSRRDVARALLAGGADRLEDAVLRALLRVAEEGLEPNELAIVDDDDAWEQSRARWISLRSALHQALQTTKKPVDRAIVDELHETTRALDEGSADAATSERFGDAVKLVSKALGTTGAEWAPVRAILEETKKKTQTIADRATTIADAPILTRAARPLALGARALLQQVAARVRRAKSERRALDFGDVMRKARDLLLAHPAIQEDVADAIDALLVDEFQDTNALQRDLVYLVRQERDAIRARNPGEFVDARALRPRGLFVVGDRKQSIYSFRGADVAVFQKMAVELAGDAAREMLGVDERTTTAHAATGSIVPLDENRRSVAPILHFVNAVAEVDMRGHDELAPVERVVFRRESEALRPVRAHDGPHPRVVVPKIVLPEDAMGNEVSRDLAACLALAANLRALLDHPEKQGLPSLRARDVAILVQTYAVLPSLEIALSGHGVEYAVGARRGLYTTQEAIDLEAFARLAVDAHDRNALLAVLRGPYVALSDTALLALCAERGLQLPDEIAIGARVSDHERARLHRLREALEDVRRHGDRLGTAPALRRALDHLGLERTLALLPRGEQRIGDLRRLLEIADDVDGGMIGFSRHLTRARDAATSIASARRVDDARGAVFDRDDDVVRILTVHGSKGLEFPVVAVMQLEHIGRPSDSAPLVVDRTDRTDRMERMDRAGEAHGGVGLALAARVERGTRGHYGEGGRRLVARALAAQRAERQRLTYVALTRARDLLFVVAGPSATRYQDHTAAHAVHVELAGRSDLAARPTWTPTASSPPRELDEAAPLAPATFGEGPPPTTTNGEVVVTTALAEFALCARRFRLLHLVGLGEHPPRVPPLPTLDRAARGESAPRRQLALFDAAAQPTDDGTTIDVELLDAPPPDDDAIDLGVAPPPLDPRARGVVAHLALERAPLGEAIGEGASSYASSFLRGEGYDPTTEPGRALVARIAGFLAGSYARSLLADDVDVLREVPFLVGLPSGASLRGTIDLLVVRRSSPRTRVEIVDYKLRDGGKSDLVRYALQLRAYAAAVALSHPGAEIVAGISFLGGDPRPLWLDDGADLSGSASIARIDEIARRFLHARATNVWPRIERKACDGFRCGFRELCWPKKSRSSADPRGAGRLDDTFEG